MSHELIRVLLVEDNPGDARLVREMLAEASGAQFELVHVARLSQALESLARESYDIILLDLSLPDGYGLDTVARIAAGAPNLPVVVMSGLSDEELAVRAVQEGAQDYLVKGRVDGDLLVRSIRYATERKRAEEEVRQRNRELSALHQVGQAVSGSLELDTVAKLALKATLEVLDLDAGVIRYVDEATQELVLLNERGFPEEVAQHLYRVFLRVKLGLGLAGAVAHEGKPLVIKDLSQNPRFLAPVLIEAGFQCAAYMPLKVRDTVVGVVTAFSRSQRTFSPADLELMAHLGNMVGVAISNSRLFEQVRALERERELERLKDEFLSVVSHELRTPLTSIHSAVTLLASGRLSSSPEKSQRMLEIAQANTNRLVRLVNDVLDIQRMESGRVPLARVACDAADLLTQAADEMEAMAGDMGVTLEVTPGSARVWADPDRVVQALTNLLSNAIRFSPQGSTVWLSAECGGEEVLLQVRDQGQGIPADKLESIFGRFQQVDVSDSRKRGGTGLGLSICNLIVEQHGGRIWAESTLGEGSAFFFTLPVVKGE